MRSTPSILLVCVYGILGILSDAEAENGHCSGAADEINGCGAGWRNGVEEAALVQLNMALGAGLMKRGISSGGDSSQQPLMGGGFADMMTPVAAGIPETSGQSKDRQFSSSISKSDAEDDQGVGHFARQLANAINSAGDRTSSDLNFFAKRFEEQMFKGLNTTNGDQWEKMLNTELQEDKGKHIDNPLIRVTEAYARSLSEAGKGWDKPPELDAIENQLMTEAMWADVGAKGMPVPERSLVDHYSRHSAQYVNAALILACAFVVTAAMLGSVLEKCMPSLAASPGQPRVPLSLTIAATYVLLIPAWGASVYDAVCILRMPQVGFQYTTIKTTDSMFQYVEALWKSGSGFSAVMVVFFVVIIPIFNLMLLLLGEFWRNNQNPKRAEIARKATRLVQVISKWASPHLFTFIAMISMLDEANHKPAIETQGNLESGFVCYSIFCILSMLTSLAIPVPEKSAEASQSVEVLRPPLVVRMGGMRGVMLLTLANCFFFFIFFTIGLFWPCMSVWSETPLKDGRLNVAMKVLVERGLFDHVDSDLSLLDIIRRMSTRLGDKGELTIGFSFVVLVWFVLTVTVLNMLMLLAAAWELHNEARAELRQEESLRAPRHRQVMTLSKLLSHCSMLDVFIVGLVLFVASARSYHESGIFMSVEPGLFLLLVAEFIHYATIHAVSSTADFINEAMPKTEIKEQEQDCNIQ
eukprot:gnl/TRDRNA2_/TRDRNA2_37593_c0_seq1.p1 gnl/TRDRNA2_/TRDRNA2_37593_c0~~gnl/TRDRNA2_/TRDRNA2_37593_c0_seq1.p1  ORF type:complete len:696 (-),score=149.75 gnl/TRDRNA2_/TRDRNA2_37593_c0_seq1:100-2187(-)